MQTLQRTTLSKFQKNGKRPYITLEKLSLIIYPRDLKKA
jgi:hypothetical protein